MKLRKHFLAHLVFFVALASLQKPSSRMTAMPFRGLSLSVVVEWLLVYQPRLKLPP